MGCLTKNNVGVIGCRTSGTNWELVPVLSNNFSDSWEIFGQLGCRTTGPSDKWVCPVVRHPSSPTNL